jgi:hypothetical protein
MKLRNHIAYRYCDAHPAGHGVCEMGETAAHVGVAAVVEWLESSEVVALAGEDTHVLRLLVKAIQEEDW